jgi:hypothetical protein
MGVLSALRAQMSHDGLLRLQTVDLRNRVELLPALNEALATEVKSLAALAVNEGVRDTIFLMHLSDSSSTRDIQAFVRAGRLRASSDAAVVVAACNDQIDGLGDEHWDKLDAVGLVGPLDGMAFAAVQITDPDSLPIRIKAAVAVEVGAWDLALTERLLELSLIDALRPDLCPAKWIDEQDTEASLHLDTWGGDSTRHAAWLVRNDKQGLAKRVWRGQLGVLFPWIEERRREVIARHRSYLRPTERTMPEVDMLDWGPIAIQLGNSDKGCPSAIKLARNIRNELAHGRPVAWPEISRCLDGFEILNRGKL